MRRFLFLVWSAASVCWIGGWGWYYHLPSCGSVHEGEAANLGWHCDSPVVFDGRYDIYSLPVMLAVIIGIPLAILVAGISLHWLALTFRDGAK
jgi:hypothetical protein